MALVISSFLVWMLLATPSFVVNDGNCSFTVAGPVVLVDPASPAAPSAGTNATYCSGNAMVDLTASGTGGTLTWYSDAALTNQIGTGVTLTPGTAIGSTSYYVTETVANCEGPAAVVIITINETPVSPTAGTDAVYCDGDALANMTASASLGGTLNWYDNAALTNLVGTGNSVAPTAIVGTNTYYVTETASGCVSPASQVVITINPLPTFATVFTDPDACGASTGSVTLTGLNAGASYSVTYNDGATPVGPSNLTADASGNIIISGLDAGSYSSFVVNDGNCSFTVAGPVVLTDPSSPVFTLTSTNPTTCGGTEGTITLNGLNANTTYDISYNDGAAVVNATLTTNASGQIVITGLDAGSYSGFIAVLTGCTGTNNGPVVLTDPAAPVAPTAGTNATYCSGDAMVDLTASGTGGTLTWYSDAALTNQIGTGVTLTPGTTIGSTSYYVTETVANCEGPAAVVTIIINETPVSQLLARMRCIVTVTHWQI
jgi:hypothetical protein